MTATFRPLSIAIAFALAAPLPAAANGVLYFLTGPVSIAGADGKARTAKKGEKVLPSERVVTGENAMAQPKMDDGSFVGVRPDSELRVQTYRPTGTDAGSVLVLDKGSVRVLNLETDPKIRPLPVQLQAGDGAAVMLRGGDLESGKPGGAFVNRLNAGAAVAQTNQGNLALAVNSVNLVTPTNISSAPVTALPPISIVAAGSPARTVAPAVAPPGTLSTLPPVSGLTSAAVANQNLVGARAVLPINVATQSISNSISSSQANPAFTTGLGINTILQKVDPTGAGAASGASSVNSAVLTSGTATTTSTTGGSASSVLTVGNVKGLVNAPTINSGVLVNPKINTKICFTC
jgi:hypothetical protein